jgi:myo-inositol-1(or 4)-monophosphatase
MTMPDGLPASDLADALKVAVEAAHRAGRLLLRGLADPDKQTTTKAHRHDPVTRYDREANSAIASRLRQFSPDWGLLSEEDAGHDVGAPICWIVDPLDGTNNFIRGLPLATVSIGLRDDLGPAVGCIFDPFRDELFTAVRGGGAFIGQATIRVSGQPSLDGSTLGIGFSTETDRRARTVSQLRPLLPHVRSLRLLGSAALDLAYVAAGRFDAIWYLSLHDWDVAAGRLLVTEAGGQVTDLKGHALRSAQDGVLATNGLLHETMLDALRDPSSP